jgi:hypothetical protein
MSDPAGERDDTEVAVVATPAGGWRLGWDAQLATFTAAHVRDRQPGADSRPGRVEHRVGVTRAAYPSPLALEEALSFPLPAAVRSALDAQREAQPALAAPRGLDGVGESAEFPRPADTFPRWSSPVDIGGTRLTWGLAVEQDRHRNAAVVELGESVRLEIVGARPEADTGAARVGYRLSRDDAVVLAGEDVRAPAGADVGTDESVRALLAVIVDPDPAHRPRLLTGSQRAFLDDHGDALMAAAAGPAAPYPRGSRVAVDVGGQRHLGRVVYPVTSRDGQALAYAWSPDVAALVGHPWRNGLSEIGEPDRWLITPAAAVAPTLARREIGLPGPGEALAFGAIVAAAHPDTGDRVEATVLRAFGSGAGVVYQVEPHTLGATDAFTVAGDDTAVVRGTWWPNSAAIMSARRAAGIDVVAGETLSGANSGPKLSVVAGRADTVAAPPVNAAQQEAALLVGVDATPDMVKVDMYGELARIGDPDHGWLVVAADRWIAAMAHSGGELRAMLAAAAPTVALNGAESVPTLAALAARPSPERLTPAVAAATGPAAAEPPRSTLRLVRARETHGAGL